MKKLLGGLLLLVGAFLGLYVGVYVCLYGGAVSMYHGIVDPSFWLFVWGVIKWALAGTLGGILFWIFSAFGITLFE